MKISDTMVRYYLDYLTSAYEGGEDEPPEDFGHYASELEALCRDAEHKGDTRWLALALEHLLNGPVDALRSYDGGQYPYPTDYLYELFHHAYKQLVGTDSDEIPEGGLEIELVPMPTPEWQRYRDALEAL